MDLHTNSRLALLAALLAGHGALAQSPAAKIQESLAGQPLYLRGSWMNDQLEFDEAGKPIGKAQAGPFTRSGIDVGSVSVSGKNLTVHGRRVALVANAEGRLERRVLGSATSINPLFHIKRPKVYVAEEEITLLVHPDAQGNFDVPLKAIFANGLDDLAAYVPQYWGCYAEGYFVLGKLGEQPSEVVQACVQRKSPAATREQAGGGVATPPSVEGEISTHLSPMGDSLQVSGDITIYMTVTKTGVPVGLQVVKAVGAGVDEQVLRTVYGLHFKPGTIDGKPVASGFEFTLSVNTAN